MCKAIPGTGKPADEWYVCMPAVRAAMFALTRQCDVKGACKLLQVRVHACTCVCLCACMRACVCPCVRVCWQAGRPEQSLCVPLCACTYELCSLHEVHSISDRINLWHGLRSRNRIAPS